MQTDNNRAVQWQYIDKLSNETVPNHTFITTNQLASSNLDLFKIELKLRDDFRSFRSKMCFRTFSTVPHSH